MAEKLFVRGRIPGKYMSCDAERLEYQLMFFVSLIVKALISWTAIRAQNYKGTALRLFAAPLYSLLNEPA